MGFSNNNKNSRKRKQNKLIWTNKHKSLGSNNKVEFKKMLYRNNSPKKLTRFSNNVLFINNQYSQSNNNTKNNYLSLKTRIANKAKGYKNKL